VLAVVSAPALPLLLIDIALAIAVAAPGVLIAKVGVRVRHPLRVGVLLPEIVLAGALVYLGVAMPVFHAAGISYQVGLAQFLAVLAGLVLGAVGLVLAGATTPKASEAGRVAFPVAVRDGVTLIVGTIVVAIGIGQIAGMQLSPPKWNWISFATIKRRWSLTRCLQQARRADPVVGSAGQPAAHHDAVAHQRIATHLPDVLYGSR